MIGSANKPLRVFQTHWPALLHSVDSTPTRVMDTFTPTPATMHGDDDLNAGVLKDQLAGRGTQCLMFRRVTFRDAATDRPFEFNTNLTDRAIASGFLAHLYRMRWDIEKSFDDLL